MNQLADSNDASNPVAKRELLLLLIDLTLLLTINTIVLILYTITICAAGHLSYWTSNGVREQWNYTAASGQDLLPGKSLWTQRIFQTRMQWTWIQIDVSDPRIFQNNTAEAFFKRLREEAPVHYCPSGDYGPFWSITKFDDIMAVDTQHEVFSSDHAQDGHMLGYEKFFRSNGTEAPMFIAMDPAETRCPAQSGHPYCGPDES